MLIHGSFFLKKSSVYSVLKFSGIEKDKEIPPPGTCSEPFKYPKTQISRKLIQVLYHFGMMACTLKFPKMNKQYRCDSTTTLPNVQNSM